jgi:CheY-like chemotaxis protein
MQILVIEDDVEVRKMISRILNDEGYQIFEANNGKQGLELLATTTNVELVITDIIMPEKDGIETIRELKQNYPAIKILAISGGGKVNAQNYLNIAKVMRVNSILSKPFTKSELLEAIKIAFSPLS